MKKIAIHIVPEIKNSNRHMIELNLELFMLGYIKLNYSYSFEIKTNSKGCFVLKISKLKNCSLVNFVSILIGNSNYFFVGKHKYKVIKIKIS